MGAGLFCKETVVSSILTYSTKYRKLGTLEAKGHAVNVKATGSNPVLAANGVDCYGSGSLLQGDCSEFNSHLFHQI